LSAGFGGRRRKSSNWRSRVCYGSRASSRRESTTCRRCSWQRNKGFRGRFSHTSRRSRLARGLCGVTGNSPLAVPRISRHPVLTRGNTPSRPVTSPARRWLRWSRTCRPRSEPIPRVDHRRVAGSGAAPPGLRQGAVEKLTAIHGQPPRTLGWCRTAGKPASPGRPRGLAGRLIRAPAAGCSLGPGW